MGCQSILLHCVINFSVTIKKLDGISRSGYFMIYAATTVFILYWEIDQPFVIHIAHHVWFNKYIFCLSIEDNHTPGYLLLQQDPEIHVHHSYLLNLIPCELYITSSPFRDKIILAY